jgi:hypothetical protein
MLSNANSRAVMLRPAASAPIFHRRIERCTFDGPISSPSGREHVPSEKISIGASFRRARQGVDQADHDGVGEYLHDAVIGVGILHRCQRSEDWSGARCHANVDQGVEVVADAARWCLLEDPGAMAAHRDGGNGQRDPAPREDIDHRRAFEYLCQRRTQHSVALPYISATDEHPPDRAERTLDPVREDFAAVIVIELDDIAHGATNGEGAGDDGSGAGPGDQVESLAEVEGFLAADAGELGDETIEERGRIDSAHAAPVQTQHPVRLYNAVGFFHYTFSDILEEKIKLMVESGALRRPLQGLLHPLFLADRHFFSLTLRDSVSEPTPTRQFAVAPVRVLHSAGVVY